MPTCQIRSCSMNIPIFLWDVFLCVYGEIVASQHTGGVYCDIGCGWNIYGKCAKPVENCKYDKSTTYVQHEICVIPTANLTLRPPRMKYSTKTVTEPNRQKLKFVLILHFMSENHFIYLLVFPTLRRNAWSREHWMLGMYRIATDITIFLMWIAQAQNTEREKEKNQTRKAPQMANSAFWQSGDNS